MKIFILLLIIVNLYASVEVRQNLRALYRGVELKDLQIEYLLDTKDINSKLFQKVLQKKTAKLDLDYRDLKSVISCILKPNGTVTRVKFLKRSDNSQFNNTIKKTLKKIAKDFEITKEEVELRFIISSKATRTQQNYQRNIKQKSSRKPYFIPIARGTTRFEQSSKEYVRVFETRDDGFMYANVTPSMCATLKVLTRKNQKVRTGYSAWSINAEIPKGKYKLLIKTKRTCDVHLQYL